MSGAVLTGAMIAGCSSESDDFEGGEDGSSGDGSSGSDGSAGSSKDIELLSHTSVREDVGTSYESLHVEGRAKNVSGDELSYAEIEVKWYSDGALVDDFLDNVNNLGAGETWAFEVQFIGMGDDASEITDYKIRAGTSL